MEEEFFFNFLTCIFMKFYSRLMISFFRVNYYSVCIWSGYMFGKVKSGKGLEKGWKFIFKIAYEHCAYIAL